MPEPHPREYRDDVVRVARDRGPGVTLEQITADFGIHVTTLSKWMRQADVDAGVKPGTSTSDDAELREARRRIKLSEQEDEVLHRAAAYLPQANLPGGSGRGSSPASGRCPHRSWGSRPPRASRWSSRVGC